jgi:glyceraldehyde-3-phosphate dehydrogenase (NAD(P))
METPMNKASVRVAVIGYGVIGKRVADAVALQEDMQLAGVADVAIDWRLKVAASLGLPIFAGDAASADSMREAGLPVLGVMEDLLKQVDVVVDCASIRFILQGGEKHELAGHSFVAESNYADALGRTATRVVSCNTTSIVRTLGALRRAGLLLHARGTLMRRATDPVDGHRGGLMNTLVPEDKVPSHQGPDARTVDPALDVVTMAVAVPQTLAHVHCWNVRMTRAASLDEVLAAFRTSSRIALLRSSDGLGAINVVKEMMGDLGRPRADLYEVGMWEDLVTLDGNELFFTYMVDNQAIVIPETIDAIRALTGTQPDGPTSIAATNRSLSIPLPPGIRSGS